MAVTAEQMETWCRGIMGDDPKVPKLPVEKYMAAIGRLESLADVPSGTPVLIRGDVDAKPGASIGDGDIRLRSMKQTLDYGRKKGWKQILFGHVGREPEKSLAKVAARLGEILGCEVTMIDDWLDPETTTVKDHVTAAIAKAPPGSVLLLENTRKYDVERTLWKAKPADLTKLGGRLAKLANELAEKVASIYIHEAFSAGSLDASSVVVPAAMKRVALGTYEAEQFDEPMVDCLNAQLVIFSGLKPDKLDDMEAMLDRGKIKMILVAGMLSASLKKASMEMDGKTFSLGDAEDPAHAGKPYYIPPARVEQAKRILGDARARGVEVVLPVDFVVQDERALPEIGVGNSQCDIGPKSSEVFAAAVTRFIDAHKGDKPAAVAFHNGVFGMFEDPRFERGTKQFVPHLKRMKDAGIKVYIGGGEGGASLERYGKPDWVTYVFTAGGTVLNALGSEPVPYLVALKMASKK